MKTEFEKKSLNIGKKTFRPTDEFEVSTIIDPKADTRFDDYKDPKVLTFQVPSKPSTISSKKANKSFKSENFTLLNRPPILKAIKPKSLVGPFDFFDVPGIRRAVNRRYEKDENREMQNLLISKQFLNQLEMNSYSKSKHTSVASKSFKTAIDVYLSTHKKTKKNISTRNRIQK